MPDEPFSFDSNDEDSPGVNRMLI